MVDKKGWFREPNRHSLASRGIPTKSETEEDSLKPTNIKTEIKTPDKTSRTSYDTRSSYDKEAERIIRMFADRNYIADLSPDPIGEGRFITANEMVSILRTAIPNGCGAFNFEQVQKLSEVYSKDSVYMIHRENGSVIVTVKGEPSAHPGLIRSWISADSAEQIEGNIISFMWLPGTASDVK